MKTIPLGDAFELVGGGTPSKRNANFYHGHIPWATVRDMNVQILTSTEHSITVAALKSSSAKVIPAGEVIIASRVGLGKACILGQDTAINQDLRGILPKKETEVDRRFLYYWLQSIGDLITSAGRGATVQGVTLPFLKSLLFPSLSLAKQQRIVAVLDEAFEGLARARANAEANLQNARGLLDAYLVAVDTHKAPLGNFATIRTGKLDANAAEENGIYPFFTCSKSISRINNYAFDCEAILLAGNNASGDFNVKHYNGKFNAYQRTYVIEISDLEAFEYRFLYFQLLRSLHELKEKSVGTGTKFLKIGMIRDLLISAPPLPVQSEISSKLEAISDLSREATTKYHLKMQGLADLRQSLLQKAFSGELT